MLVLTPHLVGEFDQGLDMCCSVLWADGRGRDSSRMIVPRGHRVCLPGLKKTETWLQKLDPVVHAILLAGSRCCQV